MARGAAARRYARALFQLAKEESRVTGVRDELSAFADLVQSNAELRDVLLQPLHPVAERRAVLDQVAERVGAGSTLRHFYAFLIDQRRLVELDAIREEYDRLANEAAGITSAEIRSAHPLSDDQLARLRSALATRTGRDVRVAVDVDPELLGGLVVKLGDVVYDGSLRTQLSQLRATLTRD